MRALGTPQQHSSPRGHRRPAGDLAQPLGNWHSSWQRWHSPWGHWHPLGDTNTPLPRDLARFLGNWHNPWRRWHSPWGHRRSAGDGDTLPWGPWHGSQGHCHTSGTLPSPWGPCHVSRNPLTLLGSMTYVLRTLPPQALRCTGDCHRAGADNRSPHTRRRDSPVTHRWVSRAPRPRHPQSTVLRVPPPGSPAHSLAPLHRAPRHRVTVQHLPLSRSPACCNVG